MNFAVKYGMKLRDVNDFATLAELLMVSPRKLNYVLNNTSRYYKSFELPKKSEGKRIIETTKGTDLSKIQFRIKKLLEDSLKDEYLPKLSQAYQSGKGIYSNAEIHRNKKYLLNIDLEDYFASFHFGRVMGFLEKDRSLLLNHSIAVIIAKLVTYDGKLPQGVPTSPLLSNYISRPLDNYLVQFARENGFSYSRYADDISLSTNSLSATLKLSDTMGELINKVEKAGFSVNWSKVTISGPDVRHVVTGLSSNRKVSVKKEFYRNTRAMVDSLFRNGKYTVDGNEYDADNTEVIEGRLSFINEIEKRNHRKYKPKNGVEYLGMTANNFRQIKPTYFDAPNRKSSLNSRELTYARFLFFKNFWYNKDITVITEGKTDPLYLKAAIRALEKDVSIRFINKNSKVLNYLLNIKDDGGTALYILLNLFDAIKNKSQDLDYANYFKDKLQPRNPTIILFDHETGKSSPVSQILKRLQLDGSKNNELFKNGFLKIKNNLYLAVIMDRNAMNSDKYEIEDLFQMKVLQNVWGHGVFERLNPDENEHKKISKDHLALLAKYHIDDKEAFKGFEETINLFSKIKEDFDSNES